MRSVRKRPASWPAIYSVVRYIRSESNNKLIACARQAFTCRPPLYPIRAVLSVNVWRCSFFKKINIYVSSVSIERSL